MAANAQRAADDPTAMAYLGELDLRRHRGVAPDHQQGGPPPGVAGGRPDQPDPAPARAAPARDRSATTRRTGAASSASARAISTRRGCSWTAWESSEQGAWPSSSTARSTAASWRPGHHRSRATRASRRSPPRSTAGAWTTSPTSPAGWRGGARRGRRSVRGRRAGPIPMLVVDRRRPARRAGARFERDPGAARAGAAARAASSSRRSGRRSTRSAPATRPWRSCWTPSSAGAATGGRVIAAGAGARRDLVCNVPAWSVYRRRSGRALEARARRRFSSR